MKTLYLKNGEKKAITTEVAKDIFETIRLHDGKIDEDHLISINNSETDFVLIFRVSEIKAII